MDTSQSTCSSSLIGCISLAVFLNASAVNAAGQPEFEAQTIDDSIKIGYGLAIEDVNGDGRKDILLADAHQIVWYESPSWTKHIMTEKLTERDHVCIAARDLDGDGKAEVAVGAGWNPGDTENSGSVHYLMPPQDLRKKWTPIKLPNEPTVHRMHWAKNWRGDWDLVVLPLHGRGNKGGKGYGVKMLAYTIPENPKTEWPTRLINGDLHMTHNFDVTQWDDDTTEEFLIAGREGVFASNWVDGAMQLHTIGNDQGGGAGEVRSGKLPDGKRFVTSIEPMHGSSVVVYTQSDSNLNGTWKRHVMEDKLKDGHAVACADLLGTGSDQIIVGWRAMRNSGVPVGIKLYKASKPDGSEWKASSIDDNQMACEDLKVADLNGDGKLDIIAAGRKTRNVIIYWNRH
ncbi:MAG: FG-GAP and VCBS repeat-containing protein [Limisphaerales bacterium]|nr:MAG: VCBS repeat-containing protein [Limisphaerales bacterium]|tara:strand:- start:2104 stop:3303 length:1200 start_codon:yes stop_codon:yes gene_type:complete